MLNDVIVAICIVAIVILGCAVGYLWAERYYNSDLHVYSEEIKRQTDREALQVDADAIASDWAAVGFGYHGHPLYPYDPTYAPKRQPEQKNKAN